MNFDPVQLQAIENALSHRFWIINGAAGCGKTTIIQSIADDLKATGAPYHLVAFAGKAAARLKEATRHPTSTIHRMLRYTGVKYLSGSLAGKTIIIDEASMVPSDLLAEITRRDPARLILVGDQAQLPPVGKGQPFHDLLHIRPDRVTTLQTCYRNSEAVYHAAMQIRAGQMPEEFSQSENERWQILHTGDADMTHRAILDMVRAGAFDFEQDIILVARNGEGGEMPCAVHSLNRDILPLVNPREQGDNSKLASGDRVINAKNYPDEDVWNGTTGTVDRIDEEGGVWVRLDYPVTMKDGSEKTEVLFDPKMKKSLSHAYALTTHKSQGSQYRNVLFVALTRDAHTLLDRSLIYTGVTRTRSKCCVVGQKSAVAVGINRVSGKRTVMQEMCGLE